MAERRRGEGRDASGTSGGADVEPIEGGMREVDAEGGELRPHDAPEKQPAAPYHGMSVPEGGLAPRAQPGEGSPEDAPGPGDAQPSARRRIDEGASGSIREERRDLENEAGNAPRTDPGARGAGE